MTRFDWYSFYAVHSQTDSWPFIPLCLHVNVIYDSTCVSYRILFSFNFRVFYHFTAENFFILISFGWTYTFIYADYGCYYALSYDKTDNANARCQANKPRDRAALFTLTCFSISFSSNYEALICLNTWWWYFVCYIRNRIVIWKLVLNNNVG